MPNRVPNPHKAFARRLRQDMTHAEAMLWRALRNRGLGGTKFRRQASIGRYIADFLCVEYRLIVELDGPPHDNEEQQQHDAARDKWLRGQGYHILRLPNDIVIGGGNIALDRIRDTIAERRGSPTKPSSDAR